MRCPKCNLENPPAALRCDCGYDFETRTMQKSYSSAAAGKQVPRIAVKDLLRIESRLNLGFWAAVIALLLYILIILFFAPNLLGSHKYENILLLAVLSGTLLALSGYIWYLISIYLTAKAINKPCGLYLLWAIGGPVLSILPIPIVSIALAVTPLIIKFLLSNEIRTMIRLQTLRDMHY